MAHPWPMFAPEANYYSMVSGAGPAPMLAYGDVLVAQAASGGSPGAAAAAAAAVAEGAGLLSNS